ncbi:MAG: UDP-N-acetylglucosamine--N-acetylmuramyl-(pentapeptide) pyrophosphoryl-undecaprenol transferase [Polyangiaceae bacterium]|nr:UDP-N-acetylglucosamine--N-acetylmuramyl-(pentapeptide) pyrophosphoryl-undecaprenol transferase [Polyangiaceae bacterium]
MATLLFAGGGTGGHVFPLLAVADAVRVLSPETRLVFVGTDKGMETRLVPERGYELQLVKVLPIRGGGLTGALRGIGRAAGSIPDARGIVARLAPRAVFSIGGYAAGPVALAARTMKVPLALMEPNAEAGLANRLIAPFVQRAYIAFPESHRYFAKGAVVQTGVPLRDGFAPAPYTAPRGALRVLVLGGSQGAKSLNEAVPRALAQLGSTVSVVHQCGRAHEDAARALYAELGFGERAHIAPFIDDMPRALGEADLVVGRAGANAVAEICAVGRPSLLVPYPFAGDHQKHNADSLAREGAAEWLPSAEATPERLAEKLRSLMSDPARLIAMADSARRIGRPHAARAIAQDLLALAELSTGPAAEGAPSTQRSPSTAQPLGTRLQLTEVA